jgi:hypothetical protein
MTRGLSLMAAGLYLFRLGAMLLPDSFAMPADVDGNFSGQTDSDLYLRSDEDAGGHKKNGPSGDRPWGR